MGTSYQFRKIMMATTNGVMTFQYENAWSYENGFYLTSPSSRLAKAIAHWEVYKKIITLPGDIVECGFQGSLGRPLGYIPRDAGKSGLPKDHRI